MNNGAKLDRLTVSELLALSPKVVRYFIDRRLHCTGCPMARFEQIEDVAEQYGLNANELKKDLEKLLSRTCRRHGAR